MSTIEASTAESPSTGSREERLEDLWRAHRERRDRGARDELVSRYYPLVQHIARRLAFSLSDRVEVCDLEGYGAVGLLDAVDRYQVGHGAQFTTYAAHRIRGAIYDGLRAVDWAPRSVRRQKREINESYGYLSIEYGRYPTEEEEAVALGVAVPALLAAKARVVAAEVGSLDSQLTSSGDASRDREPCDPDAEPGELCVSVEQSRSIQEGVRMLGPRERRVTQLSFGEGMTLAEIGELLGVSESRVCQIRTRAIRQLRELISMEGTGS